MFESEVAELQQAAGSVARLETATGTAAEHARLLTSLQQVQDLVDGLTCRVLAEFDTCGGARELGAATTATWCRRELRMGPDEARARVAAGRTLAALPQVGDAARLGRVRLAHLQKMTAGIKQAGLEAMQDSQDWLVDVSQACDPIELGRTITTLADAVHPDRLKDRWEKGMDKHDLHLASTTDGWHLTGFLDQLSGAQFDTWLQAAAAPANAADERSPSQRRTEAFGELIAAALAHGLPSDNGIQPQLHLDCDLQTLLDLLHQQDQQDSGSQDDTDGHEDEDTDEPDAATPEPGDSEPEPDLATPPARLVGYGAIGTDLLGYLGCMAQLTAILTDGFTGGPTSQARVLNVGRTRRRATPRQRAAIRARQDHTCANPGCSHTHLEIHHVTWWSHGGATDLDNLIGLCRRWGHRPACNAGGHILTHQKRLTIGADGQGGFTIHRPTGGRIPDHRVTARATRHRIQRLLNPRRTRRQPRRTERHQIPQRT